MGEWLDPWCIIASSQRTMLGGLVIVGDMEIIAPLIAVLALDVIYVMAMILDPAVSVLGT
jgi:hypothetical protein